MDGTQPSTAGAQGGYLSPKAMIVGLTLLTAGGVIGAWGVGISATAMARSFRRWLRAQQMTGATSHKPVQAKAAPATGGNGSKRDMATSSTARQAAVTR